MLSGSRATRRSLPHDSFGSDLSLIVPFADRYDPSMTMAAHSQDLARFYATLYELERRAGRRCLTNCDGRMRWPVRGVYFFFEEGEFRRDGTRARVVRVGTHALKIGSKTTLWNRLSLHRGTLAGFGSHRASAFRELVGAALLARDEMLEPKPVTWGRRSAAGRPVKAAETHVEAAVSAAVGVMPFLWVGVSDLPGPTSDRGRIERNAIALLSCCSPNGRTADRPSAGWLGRFCNSEDVRASGLWNSRHVHEAYDPAFLDVLDRWATCTT